MLIHQAIYGEKRGGHALLAHSNHDSTLFEKILDRTDLQGAMPPGAEWKSYLSGFRFQSHYILMRTHPDPTASRGGMVFSHVLFMPIDAAVQMENLRSAAALLSSEATRQIPVTPIILTVDAPSNEKADLTCIPGLQKLVGLLFSSPKRPVVWIGQEGFNEAVFGLWRCLLPEMRRSLAFKLAFGPQDAYLSNFEVVFTPDSLASRWTGFPTTADRDTSSQTSRTVQRLLSMDADAGLRIFAQELGMEVQSIGDFGLLDQVEVYLRNDSGIIAETLAAIRLLAKLSPDPGAGKEPKRKFVVRVQQQLLGASTNEIRMMRNLETQPFQDGQRVWDSVSNWTEVTADHELTSNHSIVTLLTQARDFPNGDWSRAIYRGVDNYLLHGNTGVAKRLWSWWSTDPASAVILADRTPNNSEFEEALRIECPSKLDPSTSEPILQVCRQRSWFRLHATLAMATYDPSSAIDLHLAFDQQPSSTLGVQILMSGMGNEERLKQALQRRDPRLLDIAGRACASSPALLASLDLKNEGSRAVLLAAFETNPTILGQFSESRRLVKDLVDYLLLGESINPKLWLRIALAGWGDLSLHPGRRKIWEFLSGEARAALLAATADGWLSGGVGALETQPIEPALAEAIIEPKRLTYFLQSSASSHVDNGIRLFQEFPSLSEQLFEPWLVNVCAQSDLLNTKTLSDIGRLIAARRWRTSAARIAKEIIRHGRVDLVPAAHEFVDLLGFRQRNRILSSRARRLPERVPSTIPNNQSERIVVFTALDVEFRAVLNNLSQLRTERHPQGTIYEVGKFCEYGHAAWEIAAVQTGPGNTAAAVEAERAISHFRPSYVIFVGVAGGLKDVELGDVVAATKVYGYETGKSEKEFRTRAEIGQPSYELVQLARKVARDQKWQNRISHATARRPEAVVAPIAAGEKVVASASSPVYELLRSNFSDAVAVEMESSGFLRAGYANANVGVLVVRGISDLIEGKSDADAQGSQKLASAHAAAFAFEIIANIQPIR